MSFAGSGQHVQYTHLCLRTLMLLAAANAHGRIGVGSSANTTDNLHNMGSMAFGLGTSAVGSPGFGQFIGHNPSSSANNSSLEPQLGGSLFSRPVASPHGGNHEQGTYHPFGMSGGVNAGLQDTGLNAGVMIQSCFVHAGLRGSSATGNQI